MDEELRRREEEDRRRQEEVDRDDRLRREEEDERIRAEVNDDLDYIYGTPSSTNVWDDAGRPGKSAPRRSSSGQDGIFARWGNVLRGLRK